MFAGGYFQHGDVSVSSSRVQSRTLGSNQRQVILIQQVIGFKLASGWMSVEGDLS